MAKRLIAKARRRQREAASHNRPCLSSTRCSCCGCLFSSDQCEDSSDVRASANPRMVCCQRVSKHSVIRWLAVSGLWLMFGFGLFLASWVTRRTSSSSPISPLSVIHAGRSHSNTSSDPSSMWNGRSNRKDAKETGKSGVKRSIQKQQKQKKVGINDDLRVPNTYLGSEYPFHLVFIGGRRFDRNLTAFPRVWQRKANYLSADKLGIKPEQLGCDSAECFQLGTINPPWPLQSEKQKKDFSWVSELLMKKMKMDEQNMNEEGWLVSSIDKQTRKEDWVQTLCDWKKKCSDEMSAERDRWLSMKKDKAQRQGNIAQKTLDQLDLLSRQKAKQQRSHRQEVRYLYTNEWEGFHEFPHLYDDLPLIPDSLMNDFHWIADMRSKTQRKKDPIRYRAPGDPISVKERIRQDKMNVSKGGMRVKYSSESLPYSSPSLFDWYIPYHRINSTNGRYPFHSYLLIDHPILPFYRRSNKKAKKKSDDGSDIDFEISIVTQCSIDRLPIVRLMAFSWNGPISLAVYVSFEEWSIPDDHHHFLRIIDDFFKEVESSTESRMDIHLLFETESAHRQMNGGMKVTMYPVNSLRNLALRYSRGEFVFLLDADFIPSLNLHDSVIRENRDLFNTMLNSSEDSRIALLIPAFEMLTVTLDPLSVRNMVHYNDNNAQNLTSMSLTMDYESRSSYSWFKGEERGSSMIGQWMNILPLSKQELKQLWNGMEYTGNHTNDHRIIQGFHMDHCHLCHGSTDYPRFMGSNQRYEIQFKPHSEPYVIVRKKHLHLYDARFRGYGTNKIVHLLFLGYTERYRFIVMPNQFILTAQHPKTGDFGEWQIMGKESNRRWLKGLLEIAVDEFRSRIDSCGIML